MQSTTHHPNPFLFLPSLPHPSPHPHHISPPQDTRTQLFVNNLPFRVRWQDLKDLFRKAGTVLRADVSLTSENRSKGFGTVLFANRVDAFKAVEIYNGFTWQTRILDVRLDQQDPTGVLGMAAAAAPAAVSSLQQQKQQLLQHPQQHQLVAPHLTNGLHHPAQNQHPQFPSSRPRINLNHSSSDNGDGSSGGFTTGSHLGIDGDLHQSSSSHPQQPPAIHNGHPPTRPASVNAHGSVPSNFNLSAASSPARRLSSNPELPNSTTNKPVLSYQKHQHSQSLIPFSSSFLDQPSNLPPSSFNSAHRSSSHRSSRSVQLFSHHVTPPGSTSTVNSSHPPSSHGLDVHQPEFKPGGTSLTHPLSQLDISNYSATSSIPSLVVSSVAPHSSASVESHSQSSLGPNSSQVSVVDHHASPSYHHCNAVSPYQQHIMPNATQRGPYPNNNNLNLRLLFVGNLPFNFQWQDLKDLFRQAGNILRADVATTPEGRSRGFGTVLFATAEDASKALEMYEGYELKGRTLKVHFDQFAHLPPGETSSDGTWGEPTNMPAPKFYYMPHTQQPNHLSNPVPAQQGEEAAEQPTSFINGATNSNRVIQPPYLSNRTYSDQHAHESHEDQRSDLWAPEPVTNGHRPSCVPLIIPPPLSPIASRRSSYLKSNHSSDYSEAPQNKSGNGPEPIGHPSNLARPQTIPMPPPYDLKGVSTGMMSPAIPKVIQMTPSMPAFSFQAFMPATPPLLPQFFSPGIGPPSTPPYGRGGGTPPPAMKPINSPLGASSMFPLEAERPETEDKTMVKSIAEGENEAELKEAVDEERPKKTLDSNVDWGYQSSLIMNNRRASLFTGRARGLTGNGNMFHNNYSNHQEKSAAESSTNSTTALNMKMNYRNGFSGRRLLGVGEEIVEDRFNENYNRRASFDVSSLLNNQHENHQNQNGKTMKPRPKNIFISNGSVVKNKEDDESNNLHINVNIDHQINTNHVQDDNNLNTLDNKSSFIVNNQSDRLDLVGLGFVESIWAKKE